MSSPGKCTTQLIGLAMIAVLAGLTNNVRYPFADLQSSKVATSQIDRPTAAKLSEAYGKLPLSFEANSGQFDAQVKFISRGSGYNLFLTADEAVLTVGSGQWPVASGQRDEGIRNIGVGGRELTTDHQPLTTDVLRMKLVGANTKSTPSGVDQLPGKVNRLIGNDPTS